MKNPFYRKALLCILILILVQSCSIQKRRYTGGFHLEWHNEKKIHDVGDVKSTRAKDEHLEPTVISSDSIPNVQECVSDSISKVDVKCSALKRENSAGKTHVKASRKVSREPEKNRLVTNTKSGTKQETNTTAKVHDGASSSLRMMLLSYLLIILAAALIIYMILSSIATISFYIAFIFLFLAVGISFILSIIASVKAMYSLWEIHRTPEMYTNQWQAILAIILGLLYLTFLFVIPLFIFMIKVNITKNKEKAAGSPMPSEFGSKD